MTVMAAGVHSAFMGGSVFRTGAFGNGQGGTVCPEGDGVVSAEVKPGAQASLHRGEDGAVDIFQSRLQIGHGFGERPLQFRDPVQRPAVVDDLHTMPSTDRVWLIILHLRTSVNFSLARKGKR